MNRGQLAADIHKRMVDDNRFGYSQDERWGAFPEKWTVDGHSFTINVGDYDCSSSTITAWRRALEGTPYAGRLDAATYTGNMRSVFVNSGLFEWKPMSFVASPGDLYLDESAHVAMCQRQVPDEMSEFSINERGGVCGGQRGDQTGREAATNLYREFADGILHYNGKADSEAKPAKPVQPAKPKEDADLKKVLNNGGKVRRFYNPKSGHHVWTLDAKEAKSLAAAGWKDEGIGYTAPKGGVLAVYRLFNPGNGDHLWTADYSEAAKVQKAGWVYEGVPFFGNASGSPVYRLWDKGAHHHWTADRKERDNLLKKGWKDEGTAWHV